MGEERADERGVQVGHIQLRGKLPAALVSEAQKQLEGIPVARHGVRAGVPLCHQMIGEEPLHDRGEFGHGSSRLGCCC